MNNEKSNDESKKELIRRLEDETFELEYFQTNLSNIKQLGGKMDLVLRSVEDRIVGLEGSTIPIHKATQTLSISTSNIDKTLLYLHTNIESMTVWKKEEITITKPVSVESYPSYIASMQRLQDSISLLKSSKLKAGEKMATQISSLLSRGVHQLSNLYRKTLMVNSIPLDPKNLQELPEQNGGVQILQQDLLSFLSELGEKLSKFKAEGEGVMDVTKIYCEVRSPYLIRSLQPLSSAFQTQEKQITSYRKGSTSFIPYLLWLVVVLQAEWGIVTKIFPTNLQFSVFEQASKSSMELFMEGTQNVHSRIKRNLHRHSFMDLYLLLDIIEIMAKNEKSISTLQGKAVYEPYNSLLQQLISTSSKSLEDFLEDIKANLGKQSSLPHDSTVHESVVEAMSHLKRIHEFDLTINKLVTSNPYFRHGGSNGTTVYMELVIDSLIYGLELGSKSYKRGYLSTLFLLNNYQFLKKAVKGLEGHLDVAKQETKFEQLLRRQRVLYLESWKSCTDLMADAVGTKSSSMRQILSFDKSSFKERVKNFNTELEDLLKKQKSFIVIDSDLRQEVVNDICKHILPQYSNFIERFKEADITKNISKYVRYEVNDLERVIRNLLDGGSSA